MPLPPAKKTNVSPMGVSPRAAWWVDLFLVILVFFVASAWPAPDVNEAHYVGKAKHYWNPEWAAGDFFLETQDAHLVFYWIFGWTTKFLSLSAATWVGRAICWVLGAIAWVRLCRAVTPKPLAAVLSAAVWLAGIGWFHLAGEWAVGGLEAKPLSYVFVLFGLEALVRGRWNLVWLLFGAASGVHVLIGGWSVVLAALVWLTQREEKPSLLSMAPALAGGFALSLFGLIPALLLNRDATPEMISEAYQIYVYYRLPHHLSLPSLAAPERWEHYARHYWLIGVFAAICSLAPAEAGERRLRRFVWAAIFIAVVGLVIAYATLNHPAWGARLLRFYWFRLTDVAVPLGVAISSVNALAIVYTRRPLFAGGLLAALAVWSLWFLCLVVINRHDNPRPPSDRKVVDYDAWADACQWVSQNVPLGSRFLTPRDSQTFTWRTGLPQVVTRKDIPQDAVGVVEWKRRMDDIHSYELNDEQRNYESLADAGEEHIQDMAEKYNANFFITVSSPTLYFPIVYTNGVYTVYRVGGKK